MRKSHCWATTTALGHDDWKPCGLAAAPDGFVFRFVALAVFGGDVAEVSLVVVDGLCGGR